LLTEAFQVARAQTLANCTLSATSPEEALLNRAGEDAKAGYDDFALAIVRGVDHWFRPIAMLRVVGAYQQAQKPEQAKQLLDEALVLAQRDPDRRRQRQTLLGMAFELKRSGQTAFLPVVLQSALASIRASQSQTAADRSWDLTQTLQIAGLLLGSGQQAPVLALLQQVLPEIQALRVTQFPAAPVQLLSQAATLYANLGEVSQATALLATAQAQAQALAPASGRSTALAHVARSYAAMGQVQTARALASQIKVQADREPVLQAIALQYAKLDAVAEAVKLARSLSTANNLVLSEIVRQYLAQQQYDQALQLARRERVQGILPDIALAYAEAGQPQQAMRIVEAIPVLPHSPAHLDWLLPALAQSFARSGQFDQALRVAQGIRTKVYKGQALIMIATEYRAQDSVANRAKGTAILEQALQVALSMQ
jgi:tetratricopeptide (TPR) repeat protein